MRKQAIERFSFAFTANAKRQTAEIFEANKLNKQGAGKLPEIEFAEIQRASYCSFLKPKISKYRKPTERNTQGSSITKNFHSS